MALGNSSEKRKVNTAIKDSCDFVDKALKSQHGLSRAGTKAYIKRYTHALKVCQYDVSIQRLIVKTLHNLWAYWDHNHFHDMSMKDWRYSKKIYNGE